MGIGRLIKLGRQYGPFVATALAGAVKYLEQHPEQREQWTARLTAVGRSASPQERVRKAVGIVRAEAGARIAADPDDVVAKDWLTRAAGIETALAVLPTLPAKERRRRLAGIRHAMDVLGGEVLDTVLPADDADPVPSRPELTGGGAEG